MFDIHLKIATSVSLLIALAGLFQISLSLGKGKDPSQQKSETSRPQAIIDYRYFRGGIFLIILAALTNYFILLFNF